MGKLHLLTYKASIPILTKTCECCGIEFNTQFGRFCSSNCRSKAHKRKKKVAQNLHCNFCAKPLGNLIRKGKFCCEEHKTKFHHYKRSKKKVPLQISPKLLIQTNKYEQIPAIIARYKHHLTSDEIPEMLKKTKKEFIVEKDDVEAKKVTKTNNYIFF